MLKKRILAVLIMLTMLATFMPSMTFAAKTSQSTFTLKARTVKDSSIKLSWNKVKGATKYKVYGNTTGKKLKQIATLKSTKRSFNIKKVNGSKLKDNKKYKFAVYAYKGKKKLTKTAKSKTVSIVFKVDKEIDPAIIEAFNKHKETVVARCDELIKSSDSEATKQLAEKAKQEIINSTYDETKSLDENKAKLNDTFNQLSLTVMKQRIKDSIKPIPIPVPTPTDDEAETVKIGVLRFEDVFADQGYNELMGIKYACSKTPSIKVGDKEYKFEIIDKPCSSDLGSANSILVASNELVKDGVTLVISACGGAEIRPGVDILRAAGIPVLLSSCTNPVLTDEYDNCFRTCDVDSLQAEAIVAGMKDILFEAKNVGILRLTGDAYGEKLSTLSKWALEAKGYSIVEATYTGSDDIEAALTKLAAQVDAILVLNGTENFETIKTILSTCQIPAIHNDTWDTKHEPEFEMSFLVSFYNNNAKFEDDYSAWYLQTTKEKLELFPVETALAYDEYQVVLNAITLANSSKPADIMAEIGTVDLSEGLICGPISFNGTHNATRSEVYIKKANQTVDAWEYAGTYSKAQGK